MNLYVLDTDTISLYQKAHPLVCQRADAHASGQVVVTVITVEEQLSGWYTALRQAKKRDALALAYQELASAVQSLGRRPILSFTEPAIARYEQLKTLKLGVGKMDLRIAAITLENGGILVTRNLRDFQRIPGLTIENWAV